jgi:hypothetical protein
MAAHATGAKPSPIAKTTAEMPRCRISIVLAPFGIASDNIAPCEPKTA